MKREGQNQGQVSGGSSFSHVNLGPLSNSVGAQSYQIPPEEFPPSVYWAKKAALNQWMKSHKNCPRTDSRNLEEREHAEFLQYLKAENRRAFYPEPKAPQAPQEPEFKAYGPYCWDGQLELFDMPPKRKKKKRR